MEGAVTFEFLAALTATIIVIAGIWWRIEGKISESEDRQIAEISKLREDNHELKNQILRDYVSVTHSEKTEARILDAMARLIEEVKSLRDSLYEVKYQHRHDRKDDKS